MTEVKNLIASIGPGLLNIDSLFKNFTSLYNKEAQVIQSLGMSNSSAKQLESSDQKRDDFYWAIGLIVKSHTKHIDKEIQEAAKRLLKVINKYGNLRYVPYEEETIQISNFCHEIKNYPNEVKMLDLASWIEMLEDENIRFNDYYNSMKQEMVLIDKANTGKLKVVREQVDNSYKEIVTKIEALATIQGFQVFCDFISRLNCIINNYSEIYLKSNSNKQEDKTIDNSSPVIPESFY